MENFNFIVLDSLQERFHLLGIYLLMILILIVVVFAILTIFSVMPLLLLRFHVSLMIIFKQKLYLLQQSISQFLKCLLNKSHHYTTINLLFIFIKRRENREEVKPDTWSKDLASFGASCQSFSFN